MLGIYSQFVQTYLTYFAFLLHFFFLSSRRRVKRISCLRWGEMSRDGAILILSRTRSSCIHLLETIDHSLPRPLVDTLLRVWELAPLVGTEVKVSQKYGNKRQQRCCLLSRCASSS